MKKLITLCNHKLEIELIQANSMYHMNEFHYEVNVYFSRPISFNCRSKINKLINEMFEGKDILSHNYKYIGDKNVSNK